MTDNVTSLKMTPPPLPCAPGEGLALNSVGALVTVLKAGKDDVEVDWRGDHGELQSGEFLVAMLYLPPVETEELA